MAKSNEELEVMIEALTDRVDDIKEQLSEWGAQVNTILQDCCADNWEKCDTYGVKALGPEGGGGGPCKVGC